MRVYLVNLPKLHSKEMAFTQPLYTIHSLDPFTDCQRKTFLMCLSHSGNFKRFVREQDIYKYVSQIDSFPHVISSSTCTYVDKWKELRMSK